MEIEMLVVGGGPQFFRPNSIPKTLLFSPILPPKTRGLPRQNRLPCPARPPTNSAVGWKLRCSPSVAVDSGGGVLVSGEEGREAVEYDWTTECYPLYLTKNVLDDAPLGLTVFDKQLVLYRDAAGEFRYYQDRCPHCLILLCCIMWCLNLCCDYGPGKRRESITVEAEFPLQRETSKKKEEEDAENTSAAAMRKRVVYMPASSHCAVAFAATKLVSVA